jgi:serine/threonine protein phosphatase PrpC
LSTWLTPQIYQEIGKAHLFDGNPCQDAQSVKLLKNNQWVVAVVCDGAGSAKFGLQGAQLASTYFASALEDVVNELITRAPGAWINDAIIKCALNLRDQLRLSSDSDDLKDYHTTLVAVLLGPTGGLSIHIGDGAVVGANVTRKEDLFYINDNPIISEPENGTYSNETFFITEGDWVKHLRIRPLPKLDWIILATDGGCSLVFNEHLQVKEDFLIPVMKAGVDPHTPPEFLLNMLNEGKWSSLTHDDKTVVLIMSEKIGEIDPNKLIYEENHLTQSDEIEKAVIKKFWTRKKVFDFAVFLFCIGAVLGFVVVWQYFNGLYV